MWGWIRSRVGLHHYSTWMIFGGLVLMAVMIHPSLLSVIMMALLTGWQFLTREVARVEGASVPVCIKCIIAILGLMAAMIVLIIKINWLAV